MMVGTKTTVNPLFIYEAGLMYAQRQNLSLFLDVYPMLVQCYCLNCYSLSRYSIFYSFTMQQYF